MAPNAQALPLPPLQAMHLLMSNSRQPRLDLQSDGMIPNIIHPYAVLFIFICALNQVPHIYCPYYVCHSYQCCASFSIFPTFYFIIEAVLFIDVCFHFKSSFSFSLPAATMLFNANACYMALFLVYEIDGCAMETTCSGLAIVPFDVLALSLRPAADGICLIDLLGVGYTVDDYLVFLLPILCYQILQSIVLFSL